MRKEYYSFLIDESSVYRWYVHSKGYVYKVCKSNGNTYDLKPYKKHYRMCVKASGKEYVLARLVAKTFMREFDSSKIVLHIDGDINNCDVYNLKLVSKQKAGKISGPKARSKPVVVVHRNGDKVKYRSVRSAARHLYCSYQTLLDFIANKYKSSVLDIESAYYA